LTTVFAREVGERMKLSRPDLFERCSIEYISSEENQRIYEGGVPPRLVSLKKDINTISFIFDDFFGTGRKAEKLLGQEGVLTDFPVDRTFVGAVAVGRGVIESMPLPNLIFGTTDVKLVVGLMHLSSLVSKSDSLPNKEITNILGEMANDLRIARNSD
jgi:hypothetical protein